MKNLIPRSTILDARRTIITHLKERKLLVETPHKSRNQEDEDVDENVKDDTVDDDDAYPRAFGRDPTVSPNLLSQFDLHRHPTITRVVEHQRLVELFRRMFGTKKDDDDEDDEEEEEEEVLEEGADDENNSRGDDELYDGVDVWTSEYRWIRAVPRDQCTGFHLDRVYMNGRLQRTQYE